MRGRYCCRSCGQPLSQLDKLRVGYSCRIQRNLRLASACLRRRCGPSDRSPSGRDSSGSRSARKPEPSAARKLANRDGPPPARSQRPGCRRVERLNDVADHRGIVREEPAVCRTFRSGFDPDHVLNLTISPTDAGYDEPQASQFLKEFLQRARVLPGVESASLAATIPMGYYNYGDELKIEGYETPPGQKQPIAGYNAVSAEYFRSVRIPLIRGRDFLDSDDRTSQYVAVVNEEMARRYWPNQDPIGRHFTTRNDSTHPIQVIGIAKNSRTQHLTGSFRPFFYRPFAQHYLTPVTLQLRTALPEATAFHQAVDLIHSLAPAMPVFDVQTMTQALDTLK